VGGKAAAAAAAAAAKVPFVSEAHSVLEGIITRSDKAFKEKAPPAASVHK
jgi:hypothetical protein